MKHCIIGFAFHSVEFIKNLFSNIKVFVFDIKDLRPFVKQYGTMSVDDRKKSLFICSDLSVLSVLVSEYGSMLYGKFILLSDFDSILALGGYCADFVKDKNGDVKRKPYVDSDYVFEHFEDYVVLDMERVKQKTYLYSVMQSTKTRTNQQNLIFKMTYQKMLQQISCDILKSSGVSVKQSYINQAVAKCVCGYSSLDYLECCFSKKGSVNCSKIKNMVKRFMSSPGGFRTSCAYRDILYYETPFDKAVLDNIADPFSLKLMLEGWNPKFPKKTVDFKYCEKWFSPFVSASREGSAE